MRIATWNLDAKATEAHEQFLADLKADVLLLTEVPPGFDAVAFSTGVMTPGQHYAALRGAEPLASSLAFTSFGSRDGATYLSSVLPWRGMGGSQAERTLDWLGQLEEHWPAGEVVWGGDFNHELHGRRWVGCKEGQDAINALLARRQLSCPTALLQTRLGSRSIDHVAVPAAWTVVSADLVEAVGLSDHDAVVVECTPT